MSLISRKKFEGSHLLIYCLKIRNWLNLKPISLADLRSLLVSDTVSYTCYDIMLGEQSWQPVAFKAPFLQIILKSIFYGRRKSLRHRPWWLSVRWTAASRTLWARQFLWKWPCPHLYMGSWEQFPSRHTTDTGSKGGRQHWTQYVGDRFQFQVHQHQGCHPY